MTLCGTDCTCPGVLCHRHYARDIVRDGFRRDGPFNASLLAGVHTRRQELWDSIWKALFAADIDVAQAPGVRTDAHNFVRHGLHMSRCVLYQ